MLWRELGYLPRSSIFFSLASQGTQKLFQMLLFNSEQYGQKQYSRGIHSGLNLDFVFRHMVCPSLQEGKCSTTYVQASTKMLLWDLTAVRATPPLILLHVEVQPWYLSSICMMSKPLQVQVMETLMSCQWGSFAGILSPNLASAGHFSAIRSSGRGEAAASHEPCPLLSWFRCLAWPSPWYLLHTTVISAACLRLISP